MERNGINQKLLKKRQKRTHFEMKHGDFQQFDK